MISNNPVRRGAKRKTNDRVEAAVKELICRITAQYSVAKYVGEKTAMPASAILGALTQDDFIQCVWSEKVAGVCSVCTNLTRVWPRFAWRLAAYTGDVSYGYACPSDVLCNVVTWPRHFHIIDTTHLASALCPNVVTYHDVCESCHDQFQQALDEWNTIGGSDGRCITRREIQRSGMRDITGCNIPNDVADVIASYADQMPIHVRVVELGPRLTPRDVWAWM